MNGKDGKMLDIQSLSQSYSVSTFKERRVDLCKSITLQYDSRAKLVVNIQAMVVVLLGYLLAALFFQIKNLSAYDHCRK